VHQAGVVNKKDKRGRADLGLGGVKEFEAVSMYAFGRIGGHSFAQQAVDLARGEAVQPLLVDLQDYRQHFVDALAGFGRDKQHRHVT